jgi:type II secretion system protein C
MVRYLGWLANTVLFALCCFLVANTANAIIAALLSQSPARAVELGLRSGPQSRTWNDRQKIIQRNLFHSAKLSAATNTPAAPTDEELKETELPLKLWGTIATTDPALSWASVEETGKKAAILAVRVGDTIQSATIVAIERRRVVLLENGSRRSLSLDDDEPAGGSLAIAKRSKPSTRATNTRASRRKSAKEAREATAKAAAEAKAAKDTAAEGNPSSLYSQARIVPQIDPETNLVTGLQLNAIQAGSVFEEVGIQNGEVITEIGGVPVSEMGASTKIMSALTDPDEVEIVTEDKDGKLHPRILTPPR